MFLRCIDLSQATLALLSCFIAWTGFRTGWATAPATTSCPRGPGQPRYIEVKTTNRTDALPFIISRNELDFSKEVGDAFFLYRLFQFCKSPAFYILRDNVPTQLNLEPIDYRASFKRFSA